MSKVFLKKHIILFLLMSIVVMSLSITPLKALANEELIDEVVIFGVKEPRVGMSALKESIIVSEDANYEIVKGPEWWEGYEEDVEVFKFDETYGLSIWIVAKEGYEFNPDKVNYILKGLDESLYITNIGIYGGELTGRRLFFEFRNPVSEYETSKNRHVEWDENVGGDIEIVSEGDFSLFDMVKMDDEEVDPSNYEATSGSTHIRFYSEYLETLEDGDHDVEIKFEDGMSSFAILNILSSSASAEEDSGLLDTEDDSVESDDIKTEETDDTSEDEDESETPKAEEKEETQEKLEDKTEGVEEKSEDEEKVVIPKTEDNTPLALLVSLLAVLTLGTIVSLIFNKKKNARIDI